MNKEKTLVSALPGEQIVSINNRTGLDKIKERFPNLGIIIGRAVEGDKPVSIDMSQMDTDRAKIFDAATKSIMGERVDRLDKPAKMPKFVLMVACFLLGVGATLYFYNMMGGINYFTG